MRRRWSLLRSLWRQLPLLVWLVVLWLLLWDRVTPLTVVSGIVVAAVVTRLLYLPPIELSGRFNIFRAAVFVTLFLGDVIAASIHVAWQAVDPRRIPKSSIIAVSLKTRSDLLLTLTGQAISLVPGSLVVDVDRAGGILFLHVLGTDTIDDVETFRASVLDVEERLVRALGGPADIARINRARAAAGRPRIHRTVRQRAFEARLTMDESRARKHRPPKEHP